jgi:hypothetical protein
LVDEGDHGAPGRGAFSRLTKGRKRALTMGPDSERVDAAAVEDYLETLGPAAAPARRLIDAVEVARRSVSSLSTLTAPLALEYLERLARPIPTLSLETGVDTVSRAYVAHLVTEDDPAAFGASAVPILELPAWRRGRPPQDLLIRVVKASRRRFERIRAVPTPVWDGLVRDLTRRAHDRAASAEPAALLAPAVVDGLARFGWVLRQVDLRYGLHPERN